MKRQKMTGLICSGLLILLLSVRCADSGQNETVPPADNQLTDAEKSAGWILLFDGSTAQGWRGYLTDALPEGWVVEGGTLKSLGKGDDIGGDILYDRPFTNFELSLDWKISSGGNSGIFYHIVEDEKYKSPYYTAPEYQLIDDADFPQPLADWQQTGADYAMYPADPARKVLKPAGEWNTSRILFNEGHVEHSLNGKKIVAFEAWTEDWNQRVKTGKWKEYPDYGLSKTGAIGLQDHGSEIWFKNIKIREL